MNNLVVFWLSIFSCVPAIAEEIRVSDRPLTAVSFSPDNTLLAVGGSDGTVRVGPLKSWKQSSRLLKRKLQKPDAPEYHQIHDVSFSPSVEKPLLAIAAQLITFRDGTLLGRWRVIDLWDVKAKKIIWSSDQNALKGPVNELLFSPDGKQIISADSAGIVATWNLRDSQPIMQIAISGPVAAIRFLQSGNNQTLIAGTANRSNICLGDMLYALTLNGTKLDTPFTQHCSVVSIATSSTTHNAFAVGSNADPYLQWHYARNGRQTLILHKEPVVGVAIIEPLQKLVTADDSGIVGIWDISSTNPKLVKTLAIGKKDKDTGLNITRIAVSQTHFAATHFDGTLTIMPLSRIMPSMLPNNE